MRDELLEYHRGEFTISSDPARLDLALVHEFLSKQAYWSLGIPYDVIARSVEHSLPFGVYHDSKQIGFARVITDYATFAYIGDVFILDGYRGKGLGKWLMKCIKDHPELQGLRRWMLVTRDAHELYEEYGFKPLSHPERVMEIFDPEVYTSQ
jgi:GNAT superfamily N-acetyltransferase